MIHSVILILLKMKVIGDNMSLLMSILINIIVSRRLRDDFLFPVEMFAASFQVDHEVFEAAVEHTSFLPIWSCAEILAVEAPRLEPASCGTK